MAKVAAIIDPRPDVDLYRDWVREHAVAIIHAAFMSGARQPTRRPGNVEIVLSTEDAESYRFSPCLDA